MDSEKIKIFTRNYKGSLIMSKRSPKSVEKTKSSSTLSKRREVCDYLARRYKIGQTTIKWWICKHKQDVFLFDKL